MAEDGSLRRGALSRRELAGAVAAPLGLGRASGGRGSRELARRWLARRAEADRQLLCWSRLEGLAAGEELAAIDARLDVLAAEQRALLEALSGVAAGDLGDLAAKLAVAVELITPEDHPEAHGLIAGVWRELSALAG